MGISYNSGRVVTYEYEAKVRAVTEHWSSGEKIRRVYDKQERLVEQTEGGLTTRYVYNAQGDLVEIEDNVHGKTLFQYAESGLQYTIDEEALGATVYDTTLDGLPVCVRGPSGQKTLYQYNSRGKPTVVILPSGICWRYGYDPAGQLTQIVSPGDRKITLAYDEAGQLTAVTRSGVIWRQCRYDSLGRLAEEISPLGSAAKYQYDEQGRLKQLDLPEGKATWQEQPLRQTLQGPNYKIEEELHPDAHGRCVYRPADLELKLPMDDQGCAAGIELNGLKAGYGYDAQGRFLQIKLPGGTAIQFTMDEGRTADKAFLRATAAILRSVTTVPTASQTSRPQTRKARNSLPSATSSTRQATCWAWNKAPRSDAPSNTTRKIG